MQNKVGRFKVSGNYLRDQWRDILPLFCQIVVVDCRYNFQLDVMEYTAISDLFEVQTDGAIVPLYEIRFTRYEGATSCAAVRIEK